MAVPITIPISTHESNFFHLSDNEIYRITIKKIPQGSISLDDHDYEHGFFYECSDDYSPNYYVTCKLLSHSCIVHLLNSGIDLDIINDLKQKIPISLNQKFNLERELKQILHI